MATRATRVSFFHVQDQRSFLEVKVGGFATEADIEEGLDDLRLKIARHRASLGRVRVLVDMRDALVQALANVERLRPELSSLYTRDDLVAVVVSSALQKVQEQRIHGGAAAVFLSHGDALTYLGVRSVH